MAPRGSPRRVRQVASDVLAIWSANREQTSEKMSSNPLVSVGRGAEEGVFELFF